MPSLNSEPPTATLYAEEPSALTPYVPLVAVFASAAEELAQPVALESPVDTKTVCPCAAACCHRLFQYAVPEEPFESAEMTAMARSFYSDNRRVSVAKLRDELGYVWRYPTYREGLRALAQGL